MADADTLSDAGLPGRTPPPAEPPPLPSPAVAAVGETKVMSLVDHLGELRSRLFKIILAVVVGSAIGFYFAERIIQILAAPVGGKLLNLAPGDAFSIYVRVAIVFGIIVTMPIILYQLWAFISPGLTPSERRAIRPWVPLALLFFGLGCIIAYVILPYALGFLLSFGSSVFQNELAAKPYFDFITTMFLAFGLVMEFPILLVGLARAGILSSAQLARSRRMVLLGVAIFAAVATPGGDLVSPFVLGATMYGMFELTLLFIRRSGR